MAIIKSVFPHSGHHWTYVDYEGTEAYALWAHMTENGNFNPISMNLFDSSLSVIASKLLEQDSFSQFIVLMYWLMKYIEI